jgi:hypothetical protein
MTQHRCRGSYRMKQASAAPYIVLRITCPCPLRMSKARVMEMQKIKLGLEKVRRNEYTVRMLFI